MALKKNQQSLKKWTRQKWGYTGKKGKSRYLPKAVRDSLTPAQKAAGSRAKNKATKSGKQSARYTKSECRALRRLK
jgi:hypothetical protein